MQITEPTRRPHRSLSIPLQEGDFGPLLSSVVVLGLEEERLRISLKSGRRERPSLIRFDPIPEKPESAEASALFRCEEEQFRT